MAGTFVQALPVADRNPTQGSPITTLGLPISPSVNDAQLRLDVPQSAVNFPFNNTAMSIIVVGLASWDNGATFQEFYRQGAFGSSNGTWGKGSNAPLFYSSVPEKAGVRADHFQGQVFVQSGGPISFGISTLVE